jgi:hypothetical protein
MGYVDIGLIPAGFRCRLVSRMRTRSWRVKNTSREVFQTFVERVRNRGFTVIYRRTNSAHLRERLVTTIDQTQP